ncbi:MAG TPA: PQQ-binding-like beta-propeller repeat protein [Pyrinomonadaceae bacterium]|jgi:outer membrane protein assembly factor BamB|nr:PQQ-binding-like beta-propeller repeat protein [Pyrinomonadaceae bacterium]
MRTVIRLALLSSLALCLFPASAANAQWTAKLDKTVNFYQTTELGVVLVGTEKSLYAVDGATGETLWRRKDASLDETDVAPVPGSDLLLLSFEKGERTRVEAVDILTGDTIWKSDKIRGAVMQMAIDPAANLLAVVLAKDAKGHAGDTLKRHPLLHVLDLASGDELWKYEVSEVEMMPARWAEGDVEYTLDNYYSPEFVDGRLYIFYEGLTSFDARSGKSRLRERYRVNEDGLALTEAAPIFDESLIYTSGHGRVRAISRETGDTAWEAKDLGLTPEMILVDQVLYVRTGGQFTRLKDGEIVERGSYGVSAIDIHNGKVLWRYKGADKGITNMVLPNPASIVVADRDDLIILDSQTGKRRLRVRHGVERASFGILNEGGDVVVGGQSEVAAFDATSGRELWRARHTPPGRGIFRTIAAVAARAASLYFRYGGTATTAFRGVQLARTVGGLSWSGLAARSSVSNLQALATNSARNYARSYATARFRRFGVVSQVRDRLSAGSPTAPTPGDFVRRRTNDVDERLLDRIDPAHQLERLSRFLWHRDRLAALRGNWMYFYTDLEGREGNGLAGVNIHTGTTEREIRLRDLDERFIVDEALGLMFVSTGNRLVAYSVAAR